ncbi:MAG: hypothetical protein WC477_01520 [Patescibacteria group bacterium]
MKSKLFAFALILIALSIGALAYTMWNINRTPSSTTQNGSTLSDADRQKNLDWLNSIQGVQQTTSTASASSTAIEATPTSTQAVSSTSTTDATASDSNGASIDDLGNGDALQSTTYDLASQSLILTAKIQKNSVILSWSPTKSSLFAAYQILRSTSNPNVSPDNTSPLRSIADKTANAYQDSSAQSGTTYYYRICFDKTKGNPGCGNIIAVRFSQ